MSITNFYEGTFLDRHHYHIQTDLQVHDKPGILKQPAHIPAQFVHLTVFAEAA